MKMEPTSSSLSLFNEFANCGGVPRQQPLPPPPPPDYAAIQHVPGTSVNYPNRGYYCEEDTYPSYYEYPQYAPCEGGPGPWNFNYCYGFFGEPPCPYANVIDMEDFM